MVIASGTLLYPTSLERAISVPLAVLFVCGFAKCWSASNWTVAHKAELRVVCASLQKCRGDLAAVLVAVDTAVMTRTKLSALFLFDRHLAARVTSKRSKRKRADSLVRAITTVSTATKTAARSPRHFFCSEAQTTLSSALCATVQLEALQHLANPQTKRTTVDTPVSLLFSFLRFRAI